MKNHNMNKKSNIKKKFKYNYTWQHDSLIKLGFIKSKSSHVVFDNS